jgi:hypothetical protein
MPRKYTIILTCIIVPLLFVLAASRAEGIDTTRPLFPGEAYTQKCEYNEKTDIDNRNIPKTQLVIYLEPEALWFESEKPCSVYVVSETQFIVGNASNWTSFTPGKAWVNRTHIYEELSFVKITSPVPGGWGMPVTVQDLAGSDPVNVTTFHIVVINEASGNNTFVLRYLEKSPFLQFVHDFTYNLIVVLFFAFAILLLVESRRVGKDNPIRGNILKNYSAGLVFGGVGTGAWEVWHWVGYYVPSNSWADYLAFQGMPSFLPFSAQTLSFVTFTALGFSLVFMSFTVEKSVQNRKIPYLTYFLLANQGALIVGIFVPALLYVVIFTWIASLALVAVNIAIAYTKAMAASTGQLRKKSIFILFGLLFTFLFIILRDYVRPNFVGNFVVIIFMIVLYKGLKMER